MHVTNVIVNACVRRLGSRAVPGQERRKWFLASKRGRGSREGSQGSKGGPRGAARGVWVRGKETGSVSACSKRFSAKSRGEFI